MNPGDAKKLKIGVAVENDIYKLAGQGPSNRLSFKPVIPIRHAETYLPIDRIIIYKGFRALKEKHKDGKYLVTSTSPREKMGVIFYLYNNKLIWYSVVHKKTKNVNGNIQWYYTNDTTSDVIAINQMNYVWPDGPCIREYYSVVVLKERKPDGDECYWQAPDFEQKLKESGYYAKLNFWDRWF